MLHLDLDPGETIILEMRKHWFIFLGPLFIFIFAVFAPWILYMLLQSSFAEKITESFTFIEENLFIIKFFFYPAWVLVFWVSLFVQWTNYYLDVWYITDKRIIDIDQKSLFNREISNLRFDRIQDVSLEVKGFIGTLLGFGDIRIQTAAENSKDFKMRNAYHPERVKKIVFSQHNIVSEQK